jgi:hypothetical protein
MKETEKEGSDAEDGGEDGEEETSAAAVHLPGVQCS